MARRFAWPDSSKRCRVTERPPSGGFFVWGRAVLAWPRCDSRERLVAAMLNLGEVPKSRDGCDDQHGTKYASERGENKTRVHNSACLKSSADYFSWPPVSEVHI